MIVVIAVLGLILCMVVLSCIFYWVWRRERGDSESNDGNGVHLVGHQSSRDGQFDCESDFNGKREFNLESMDIANLGWELKTLLAKKLGTVEQDCDVQYQLDITRLILFSLDIWRAKEIPDEVPKVPGKVPKNPPEIDGEEAPGESYPVLADVPPKFHAIVLTHCRDFGIPFTATPDVRKCNT